MKEKYLDRKDAGQVLADLLTEYANRKDVIVLALPRGGVPVAYQIAKALHAPLDVFIVRKLGVPRHEELAMGAIATGNVTVFNEDIITELAIPKTEIQKVIQEERQELERREKVYRGDRPFPDLKNKIIILVDDGIATGATIRAAIKGLKQFKPKKLIAAVPVADPSICEELSKQVDTLVCPLQPLALHAVGLWYDEFEQTSDAEVHELLGSFNNFFNKHY